MTRIRDHLAELNLKVIQQATYIKELEAENLRLRKRKRRFILTPSITLEDTEPRKQMRFTP